MKIRPMSLPRQIPRQPHGVCRRALDLSVSVLAGVLLAPAMLIIALALWLPNGDPVFFVQTRIGSGGRLFRIYKFRKFHVATAAAGLPLTVDGDERMTPIGRFLAATKLDECPQLWNVLRGDMAIVGPRPESLAFADCFRGGFEQVLSFRPGLLGPSQVYFRNESSLYPRGSDPTEYYRMVLFPAKARLDLAYFPTRTIGSDIQWLVRGVLATLGHVPSPSSSIAGSAGIATRSHASPVLVGSRIEGDRRK